MTAPLRQLLTMLLFLALVILLGVWLYTPIQAVFLANPWLNALILTVFAGGVVSAFLRLWSFFASIRWIGRFVAESGENEAAPGPAPALVAPMAALMRDRRTHTALSAQSMRSVLDAVGDRLAESSDVTSYIRGLLIFLGLLGTFWGLANSVPAVIDTIRHLAPQPDDGASAVFRRLMIGLEGQLGGMATAFASSLLGLSGSMIVGFLELQTGHAAARFYRELEEWLSHKTWLAGSQSEGGSEAFLAGLMEHFSERVERLADMLQSLESRHREADDKVVAALSAFEATLAHAAQESIGAQSRLNETLDSLLSLLRAQARMDPAIDQETRRHIRNLDIQLLRAVEEMSAGREDVLTAIRSEMRRMRQLLAPELADRTHELR